MARRAHRVHGRLSRGLVRYGLNNDDFGILGRFNDVCFAA